MRLTLRTLLSWKDGMLDAEAARDLSARVEASGDARTLVARIDEVVSRPTLSAPAPEATGFAAAANTTAEYLDNVLPVEQLGEFERVCFASESQLAETAAVHELLADLSRTPAATLAPAASRKWLATARARAEGGGSPALITSAPAPATPRHPTTGRVTAAPAASARPATSAWLLVGVAIMLLVTLVGVLGWTLTKAGRARHRAREVAARKAAAAPAVPAGQPAAVAVSTPSAAAGATERVIPPIASPAVEPSAPHPPTEPIPVTEPTPVPDAAVGMPAANAPPESPAPETTMLETPVTPPAPTAVASVEQRVPQGDALAIAAPITGAPPSAPRPAAAPRAPLGLSVTIDGPDVVLVRPAEDRAAEWLAAARAWPLDAPVDLVAPPFCRPTLSVNGVRIALEPGTRAVLGCDATGTPQLEVVFGAATIAGAGRVGLVAGGLSGSMETGPAAPVGVEVVLRRPPGAAADMTQRTARLIPTAGRVGWQPGNGPAGRDVVVGQALEWRSGAASEPEIRAIGSLPAWLAGATVEPFERRAAAALAAGLPAGDVAVPVLRDLAAHRRVENRAAAAAALALVGEFDEIAALLVADGGDAVPESVWNRLDDVAIQPALARGARAADAFAAAITSRAPAGSAATVIHLASGIGDADLAAGAAAELVAALESPHLVVRRYAIRNLVEIVEPAEVDRLRYRADRPLEELRADSAWWRTQLERGRVHRVAAEENAGR